MYMALLILEATFGIFIDSKHSKLINKDRVQFLPSGAEEMSVRQTPSSSLTLTTIQMEYP